MLSSSIRHSHGARFTRKKNSIEDDTTAPCLLPSARGRPALWRPISACRGRTLSKQLDGVENCKDKRTRITLSVSAVYRAEAPARLHRWTNYAIRPLSVGKERKRTHWRKSLATTQYLAERKACSSRIYSGIKQHTIIIIITARWPTRLQNGWWMHEWLEQTSTTLTDWLGIEGWQIFAIPTDSTDTGICCWKITRYMINITQWHTSHYFQI